MNEVSGKILGLYHRAAEHFQIPEEALFDGLPIAPGDEPDRLDWDTLCELSERLERLCAGRATLDQVGELLISVPKLQRTCAAIQLVASPRMLYWAAHLWAGPAAFIHHTNTCDEVDGGRLRLTTTIAAGYRDSPQFFRITQGVLRTIPRLLGLPDARVDLALSPMCAVFVVDPPPSLTLWSRFTRGLRVVFSARAALAELRDQNDALRARFHELAAAHDEADRLRRDAELARDEAHAALRVKSEFLATVSHELRTPLNGIVGLTDILLATPLSADQREYAETVQSSANTLVGLISDVLDFSKSESGKLALVREAFAPRALAEGVGRVLVTLARRKGIDLELELDDALPATAVGDGERVRQVLVNLVGNALKFTERGAVTVRAESGPRGDRGATLRFTVTDTGIGVARECMARIFEPFTQADASASRRFGGTGIGLAICRRLVRQMGGEIGVESELGRGSTFWFTVPVDTPDEAPALPAPAPAAKPAPLVLPVPAPLRPHSVRPRSVRPKPAAARSLRPRSLRPDAADPARPWVLLVDDNPVNLKVAAHALKRLEYNVVTATGGVAALELFAARAFDAVLMDCQMPEMDGYETTAKIRELEARAPRHTPVIAVTANVMEGDRERCLASGMDDYIPKPVKLDLLRDALMRWLVPARRSMHPAVAGSLAPAAL